ncbi:MAG TPA: 6-phosphogluconolactonase [Actinomycetota bacterium]|nr:6-phosphogluconolactonase [Actinomycetota bacterium]
MLEEVLANPEAVASRVATLVAEEAPATVAIASSPSLRPAIVAAAGALSNAAIWFADDRCGPTSHPESAAGFAAGALPGAGLHRIRGEDPPGEAARIYDEEIRAVLGEEPVFDLVLLAAGGDGRVAGLFPDAPELGERERRAVATGDAHGGLRRVTLTLPVLNRARRALICATGSDKAVAVARCRDGELLPAARVLGATWLLDEAAAAPPPRPARRKPWDPLEGQEVLFEL